MDAFVNSIHSKENVSMKLMTLANEYIEKEKKFEQLITDKIDVKKQALMKDFMDIFQRNDYQGIGVKTQVYRVTLNNFTFHLEVEKEKDFSPNITLEVSNKEFNMEKKKICFKLKGDYKMGCHTNIDLAPSTYHLFIESICAEGFNTGIFRVINTWTINQFLQANPSVERIHEVIAQIQANVDILDYNLKHINKIDVDYYSKDIGTYSSLAELIERI